MRKSNNSKLSNYSHENQSTSPNTFTDRRSPSSRVLESFNSNTFLKVGIYAINSEKKHSLLSVPKTPIKFLNMCNENKTPSGRENIHQELESIRSINSTSRFQLPRLSSSSQSVKQVNKSYNSRYSAVNCCRLRQNPNHENLKKALEELEKSAPKNLDHCTLSNTVSENPRSDIELLIESQRSNEFRYSKSPEQVSKLDLDKISSASVHKSQLSQRSDPSPVRKNKAQARRLENCKSSKNRVKSILKIKKTPVNFQKKFTRDYFSKNRGKIIDSSASEESSSDFDYSHKLDYQEASMRILKNTSSFAKKIMKGMRGCGNKKFY